MQYQLRAADAVRHEGRLAAPMGHARFPLVDTRDVGAAAAVVLGNPAAHAGKAYALTGPVAQSYDDVAAAFAIVAGHAVAYEPVAPEDFQARLLGAGMPDWRAFDLAPIPSPHSAPEKDVSPPLPMPLGRQPRAPPPIPAN